MSNTLNTLRKIVTLDLSVPVTAGLVPFDGIGEARFFLVKSISSGVLSLSANGSGDMIAAVVGDYCDTMAIRSLYFSTPGGGGLAVLELQGV